MVLAERLHVAEPVAIQIRVGARPQAQPLPIGPVAEIVPARMARPRKIRHLVLDIPRTLEPLPPHFIQVGHRVPVREGHAAALHLTMKRGPLFNRQAVEGQVVRLQRDRGVQVGQPAGGRLPRKPVDEVQVHRRQTGVAR